ncbi:MAG: hypothetical protein WCJ19_03095 [bacterium]
MPQYIEQDNLMHEDELLLVAGAVTSVIFHLASLKRSLMGKTLDEKKLPSMIVNEDLIVVRSILLVLRDYPLSSKVTERVEGINVILNIANDFKPDHIEKIISFFENTLGLENILPKDHEFDSIRNSLNELYNSILNIQSY